MGYVHTVPVSNEDEKQRAPYGEPALPAIFFGFKRHGFRSQFPRFERKRKCAAHPTWNLMAF
jgi:hypothetical protein